MCYTIINCDISSAISFNIDHNSHAVADCNTIVGPDIKSGEITSIRTPNGMGKEIWSIFFTWDLIFFHLKQTISPTLSPTFTPTMSPVRSSFNSFAQSKSQYQIFDSVNAWLPSIRLYLPRLVRYVFPMSIQNNYCFSISSHPLATLHRPYPPRSHPHFNQLFHLPSLQLYLQ